MSITVNDCPFCGQADVEIYEVSTYEFAVECPECRCIGPITYDVMSAIAAWNKADKTKTLVDILKVVKHYFTLCDMKQAPAMSLEEEEKLIADVSSAIEKYEVKKT